MLPAEEIKEALLVAGEKQGIIFGHAILFATGQARLKDRCRLVEIAFDDGDDSQAVEVCEKIPRILRVIRAVCNEIVDRIDGAQLRQRLELDHIAKKLQRFRIARVPKPSWYVEHSPTAQRPTAKVQKRQVHGCIGSKRERVTPTVYAHKSQDMSDRLDYQLTVDEREVMVAFEQGSDEFLDIGDGSHVFTRN
ncbi:hypothetical protein HQ945_03595 [Phyllobacterium sp. BT25]|uniref:Uncharacterized protein n=1 Tax=Phyllobacterium pellucidum TaxID=2740464 RepID=A0A849VNI3_9HYPH|nr:hypothetical protein [Phyllobacterium pellucidum]NTS30329.1 hypothetical protein [Phyllobacterium pellucidum]